MKNIRRRKKRPSQNGKKIKPKPSKLLLNIIMMVKSSKKVAKLKSTDLSRLQLIRNWRLLPKKRKELRI